MKDEKFSKEAKLKVYKPNDRAGKQKQSQYEHTVGSWYETIESSEGY
jgi:hypothetical protein